MISKWFTAIKYGKLVLAFAPTVLSAIPVATCDVKLLRTWCVTDSRLTFLSNQKGFHCVFSAL